jgi:phosphatidate cytidylyltransferase
MLLTRVITAVCLLIVILPILFFAPPAGLAGLVTVVAALAAWEWGRLAGLVGAGCLCDRCRHADDRLARHSRSR